MTVLSGAELGGYYVFVPVSIIVYSLLGAGYLYKFQNNTVAAVGCLVWSASALTLSHMDLFIDSLYFSRDNILDNLGGLIWFNVAFAVPLSVLAYCWWNLEWFRDLFLHQVPAYLQIAFQSFRVCGFAYIYLWAKGIVPNFIMAYVGFSDAFIALTAIPLALYVRNHGLRKAKYFMYFWSICGILDISVAFVCFFLNFFGIYSPDTSLAVFMLYPVSYIVLFNVGWIIFKHIMFLINMDTLMDTNVNQGLKPIGYETMA